MWRLRLESVGGVWKENRDPLLSSGVSMWMWRAPVVWCSARGKPVESLEGFARVIAYPRFASTAPGFAFAT